MEKIFILDKPNSILKTWFPQYSFIEVPTLKDDIEWDDFIQNHFVKPNIEVDKLLIPAKFDDQDFEFTGLKFAMHFRLTENLYEKRLCPIVVSYRQDMEHILSLQQGDKTALLLSTPGTILSKQNKNSIEAHLAAIEAIKPQYFKSKILNQIIIQPLTGNHGLANIWGAFILDEIARTKTITINRDNEQKKLYFKYLQSQFYDFTKLQSTTRLRVLKKINLGQHEKANVIPSSGKKVLFIDDKAEPNWAKLLKKIFKNSAFDYVKKSSTYQNYEQDIKTKVMSENWDLILLDLRLKPEEEQQTLAPAQYSGATILQFIKSHNRGLQTIIFTASNKAWNMKKLLDLGADGYYIKEAPLVDFDKKMAKLNYENLKEDIEICYEKGYLKDIFVLHKAVKVHFATIQPSTPEELVFLNELSNTYQQAFDILSLADSSSINKKYYNYAFMTYFKIFEILNNFFITEDKSKNEWVIGKTGISTLDYEWNRSASDYQTLTPNYPDEKPTAYGQIMNIVYQYLQFDLQKDTLIGQQLYRIIKDRNAYIHPPKPGEKDDMGKLKRRKDSFKSQDCINIAGIIHQILLKLYI